MKKAIFAVFSGVVAGAAAYVLVVIGAYVKCFFNDITFVVPVALDGGLKAGVLTCASIFLLQLLAGTRRS